jgi:hypothetical protein
MCGSVYAYFRQDASGYFGRDHLSRTAGRVDELARRKKRIAAHGPDMPVAVIIPASFAGNNRHAQHVVKLRKHNLEKELSHQEARWHPTNISSINAT